MDREHVIKKIKQLGLRPQRAAGQHFLIDQSVVKRMVAAAEVTAQDTVLEIGPGFGVLTTELLQTGAKVIAVELDKRLASSLRQTFRGQKNFQLIEDDIFNVRLDELFQAGKYKLVANLPYSSTSLILRNFLTLPPQPISLTVMIQKEVAERVAAQPGFMSLLSLMAQYVSQPKLLFPVPRTSFEPPPEVTSMVIQLSQIVVPDPAEMERVFRLARAAFAGRRKQLHNTLGNALSKKPDEIEQLLTKQGISPQTRPQELSVDDWRRLANHLF